MKIKGFMVRVSQKMRGEIEKEGKGYRTLSAFVVSMVRDRVRYGRLMAQARELERRGFRTGAMRVEV